MMTPREATDLLHRLQITATLKHWGVTVRPCYEPLFEERGAVCAVFQLTAIERDAPPANPPNLVPLQIHEKFEGDTLADPYSFLKAIRDTILMKLFSHEVDECLVIDGVRLFDPHMPREWLRAQWEAAARKRLVAAVRLPPAPPKPPEITLTHDVERDVEKQREQMKKLQKKFFEEFIRGTR